MAPEWKKAAGNLKGKVKLGHVDCDAEKVKHWSGMGNNAQFLNSFINIFLKVWRCSS